VEISKKFSVKESFNLGKGWYLMIFAILAMFVNNAGVNDGLNVALPAISKGAKLNYEICLSMGTVAGFVGVISMFLIAKLRDRFGGRKVSTVLFIINGLTFYFLFLRANGLVMYGLSQCIMVSCGQGTFYLCTGPMQSTWFPKKRGVVNGISTIGANLGTALLVPIMSALLTIADYQVGLSVFAVASILLGIFAFIFLRDTPQEAGVYPDNVTKAEYESEYKTLSEQDNYVSDWTLKKILTTKETYLAAIVPGFITIGLLGIITQFVKRNVSLGLTASQAIGAMTICGILGILGSYYVGYLDTKLGTKKAAILYCGYFALGILCNLLAVWFLPLVYASIFIIGTCLGGCTNMILSYPTSIFGVLDYPKVNGVIFPITYCIGNLNFVVNAIVLKLTASLTGAYIIFFGLFIINIIIIANTETGKWDKLRHPELMQK
jgi:OFA family oxalate/formate antiporter-like MFS transporter